MLSDAFLEQCSYVFDHNLGQASSKIRSSQNPPAPQRVTAPSDYYLMIKLIFWGEGIFGASSKLHNKHASPEIYTIMMSNHPRGGRKAWKIGIPAEPLALRKSKALFDVSKGDGFNG